MCSPGAGGRQRTGGVPVSRLRVRGTWETQVSSVLGPPDSPSQKSATLSSCANDAPPGGPGPSCPQDQYVWRLTQLLGSVPPGQGELRPCSSDSICTEDFAAHFRETMVEAGLPAEEQEEGARAGSPESLGGHISRVSRGSLTQPLSSQSLQQPPKCSSPPKDPSPRLGPAALGTAGGRSLPHLGYPFPERQRPKRDSGAGLARSQGGGPGGPRLHTGSRNPWLPLPPSPHWDQPSLHLLPQGPAFEAEALRQPLGPLAGPQDPRLPLGRLPACPWDPESILPSCPMGYRSLSSQKEEPRLSHRKGLKKEQETPGDPKLWKKKPARMKHGGPGRLGITGAMNARHEVARADSGTSGRQQQLMPETPAGGEAPRPGSPGPGLALLGALIEAIRRRLWDVHRQTETLGKAVQELQRARMASMPSGCQGSEPSAMNQAHDAHEAAGEHERPKRGLDHQDPSEDLGSPGSRGICESSPGEVDPKLRLNHVKKS